LSAHVCGQKVFALDLDLAFDLAFALDLTKKDVVFLDNYHLVRLYIFRFLLHLKVEI